LTPSSTLARSLILLALLLFGSIIYSNSFKVSFHYDDQKTLVQNNALHNPFELGKIWQYGSDRFIPNWTLSLNYYFGGFHVFGYHFFNLIIHVLASFLCYLLLLQIFQTPLMQDHPLVPRADLLALLVSLLFLCHPIQTQAVTYIVQRSAMLAALFYFTTLYLVAKERMTGERRYYFLALLTACMAAFSKQTSFTLPFALLLYSLCFFDFKKEEIRKRIAYYAPFFIFPIASYMFCKQSGSMPGSTGGILHVDGVIPHGEYLLTQIDVIRTYLRLLFLPMNQNLDYDYPISTSLFRPQTFYSLLLLVGLLVVGILSFKKHRLIAFGILWFFLTLSVESIANLNDVIYEHRLYLPLLGFAIVFSSALFMRIRDRNPILVISFWIIVVLSFLTFQRNNIWENEITLWKDVVKKSPNKGRVHYALGNAYMKQHPSGKPTDDQIRQATQHFEMAIRLRLPQLAEAHNGLAIAHTFLGDFDKAVVYYEKALYLKPDYTDAQQNLKKVQGLRAGSGEEQKTILKDLNFAYGLAAPREAASPQPVDVPVISLEVHEKAKEQFALGHAAMETRSAVEDKVSVLRQAAAHYEEAVRLNPGYAEAYNSLAITRTFLGELVEAVKHYKEALRLKPGYSEAQRNLLMVEEVMEKSEEERNRFIESLNYQVGT